MKFKRILCGVDFSPGSVRAFETAVELARWLQAELHIMHVIEADPTVPEWFPERGVDEALISLEEKALTAMETLVAPAAMTDDGLVLTTEVTSGRAFAEILQRARDRASDLIVLGAKGLTLLEDPFIGGTAEHVMKEAACSVLVVRD